MKITSIKIQNENSVLKDFHWNSDKLINIFIGENGSGKTTILKNLVWIFRAAHDLYVNKNKNYTAPSFSFEIIYQVIISNVENSFDLETNYVEIRLFSSTKTKNFCEIEISNSRYSLDDIINKFGYKALLPSNVIAYYSGWDDKIKTLFNEVEDDYKDIMIKDASKKLDIGYSVVDEMPLIYIENIHFQILLACLFSFQYNSNLYNYLNNKLGVVHNDFTTISIFIKKPIDTFYNSDTEDFWGAKGELRRFLDVLKHNAQGYGVNAYNEIEKSYIFTFDLNSWITVKEFYGTEKRLYFLFHLLNSSGFLGGFHIYFEKDGLIQSNHNLSEGEQQLLTIIGLKEILFEQNSLLLLDEPDTFLHPIWQQNFISDLSENMEFPKGGEIFPFHNEPNFFITTHSLNLLNNANKDIVKVTLMQNGKVSNLPLQYYGRTIASVNYNLMNVTERPKEIQDKLNSLFEYLELEKVTESEILYQELSKILGNDDEDLIKANIELEFLKSDLNG
jgi:ABC-type cobalamin/Fe3+-siderophores transport system ATPase subunit